MKKLMLALVCILSYLSSTAWAMPPKTVLIEKDTAELSLQIKYPQGFANKVIDKTIAKQVDAMRKANMPVVDKSLPAEVPGKNGLYIDYTIEFQNAKALSVLFTISSNIRGAAHPDNKVQALNFINGQPVTLAQLFKQDSQYLATLSQLSRAVLNKKDIDDKEWIAKGTEPTLDNYKVWTFSDQGLTLVFGTYQVAAYVYGPQSITIPKSELLPLMQSEVANVVWGK